MKRKFKNIIIATFIIIILSLSSSIIIAKNVSTVEIIPEKPKPQSDIDIKANIDFEGIENVYLQIQECDINTGICYERQNLTLNKLNENTFITSYTLKEAKATYIQFDLIVKTEFGWETPIKENKINLDLTQTNGDNNGGNGDQDTPGFEIMGLFLGLIFIIFFINKKKR
jgi:hypothetical protein